MAENLTNAALGHLQARQEILEVFRRVTNPEQLAETSGAAFMARDGGGVFVLPYYGEEIQINYPGGEISNKTTGQAVPVKDQIVLLNYLVNAVAVQERDEWKTFKELSAAPHHWNVFIPEAIEALAKGFGNDLKAFQQVAPKLGGRPVSLGDVGYRFAVLPRIVLQIGLWEGDEEFPAHSTILFNTTATMQADTATLFSLAIGLVRRVLYLAGKRAHP